MGFVATGWVEAGFSEVGLGVEVATGWGEVGFSEVGFSESDFSEVGFSGSDFSESDFSEVDFSESDFSESDFSESDFSEFASGLEATTGWGEADVSETVCCVFCPFTNVLNANKLPPKIITNKPNCQNRGD